MIILELFKRDKTAKQKLLFIFNDTNGSNLFQMLETVLKRPQTSLKSYKEKLNKNLLARTKTKV